jgi:hypothetical protein
VAVPPEEDALVEAPLADGVAATTDALSAPTAMAAQTDLFNHPMSPMHAPLLAGRPGDGR